MLIAKRWFVCKCCVSWLGGEIAMDANQIRNDFVSRLRRSGGDLGFQIGPWLGGMRRVSNNIIQLRGSMDCVVYFHVRSTEPYRWGVTANRIDELKQSGKDWVLVLLFESAESGYLLTPSDVDRYLSIWPLAADGDHKVSTGSYLQFNKVFSTFEDFINSLARSLGG